MSEHDEQVAIIQWRDWNANRHPALKWLHAIPNGAKLPYRKDPRTGRRYSPEAMRLKAEGLTPGIPDLCLPFPAKGYHGLYIENKAPGKLNEVRDGQRDFMDYAESVGYLCQVHDSAEAVIELITWYLDL